MPRLNQQSRKLVSSAGSIRTNYDPVLIQPQRSLYSVVAQGQRLNPTGEMGGNGMYGSGNYEYGGNGFADILKKVVSAGVLGKAASSAYSSNLGTSLRNMIPASDEGARPGYPGEKHMILKLPNGKNGVANWMGPNTAVIQRLKRDDPGRTPSDTVAKRHDIDFTLASGVKSPEERTKMGRIADRRMINSMKRIKANRLDAGRNITAGLRLIQAKTKLEDAGLMDPLKFIGPHKEIPADEKALLTNAQAKLTQQGYGLPGDQLKKKLLSNMKRKKKLSKLKGSGLGLAGGDVKQFIIKQILPSLIKELGFAKSVATIVAKIKPIIPKIIKISKPGGMKALIGNLSKALPPLLAKHGFGMKGRGVLSVSPEVGRALAKGLWQAWKLWRNAKGQGGKGFSLAGSGFWKDFVRGFKSTFVPGSKILAGIAGALGQPEIAIPLGIAGTVVDKL